MPKQEKQECQNKRQIIIPKQTLKKKIQKEKQRFPILITKTKI